SYVAAPSNSLWTPLSPTPSNPWSAVTRWPQLRARARVLRRQGWTHSIMTLTEGWSNCSPTTRRRSVGRKASGPFCRQAWQKSPSRAGWSCRIAAGVDIAEQRTHHHLFVLGKMRRFRALPGLLDADQRILLHSEQWQHHALPQLYAHTAARIIRQQLALPGNAQHHLPTQHELVVQVPPQLTEARIIFHVAGQLEIGLDHALHTVGDQGPEETRALVQLNAAGEITLPLLLLQGAAQTIESRHVLLELAPGSHEGNRPQVLEGQFPGSPTLGWPASDVGHPVIVERAHLLRSEEHTSELQSRENLVCRLLLEKKNNENSIYMIN